MNPIVGFAVCMLLIWLLARKARAYTTAAGLPRALVSPAIGLVAR